MLLFPELFLKIESELIFTIVILQFKTGVKSTLTSQNKELGAINTFGIKNWINLNLDWSKLTNTINIRWLALMAMRMDLGLVTLVVGSVQQRKQWFSLEKWENKAV